LYFWYLGGFGGVSDVHGAYGVTRIAADREARRQHAGAKRRHVVHQTTRNNST
jgi:hypothetical protein